MDIIGKIASHSQNKPFSFLDDVDAGELLNILKFERNQTLALVMTYMDSEQAARKATAANALSIRENFFIFFLYLCQVESDVNGEISGSPSPTGRALYCRTTCHP